MNPQLLPKVRSARLMSSCARMPCTLRIASFVGMSCAAQNTVVGCHLPTIGKGVATKVSDLYVAAGCQVCHDLLDWRNPVTQTIVENYPFAFAERMMKAHHETMGWWVKLGVLPLPEDAEVL